MVSVVWTASLVSNGVSAGAPGRDSRPDRTPVPVRVLEAPASISAPGSIALGVPEGARAQMVRTAATNSVPAAALAAYQRADTVINASDETCRLPWELVAAIGRVESDHGRYGGNTLDAKGVARPGIYGMPLDGTNNTRAISDTDAGQYDNDTVHDRAVGPMQFIPSTWTVVGVDADGDAQRNPQDIDDAALAAAVYLCSGDDDLSTDLGRRKAVHRYNHSRQYVDLVLSIMAAYTDGDYYSAPNMVAAAVSFIPDGDPVRQTRAKTRNQGTQKVTTDGTTPSTPTTSSGTAPPKPTSPSAPAPTRGPTETVQQLEATVTTTVQAVISLPQAILRCTAQGLNLLTTPAAWNTCIASLTK